MASAPSVAGSLQPAASTDDLRIPGAGGQTALPLEPAAANATPPMRADTISSSGSSASGGIDAYRSAFNRFVAGTAPAAAPAIAPGVKLPASPGSDTIARSDVTAPGGVHEYRSAFEPRTSGGNAAAGFVSSAGQNGDATAPAGAVKDSVIGVAAHRQIPHRYELRSIKSNVNAATGKVRNPKTGLARGRFQVRFDRTHLHEGAQTGPHVNLGIGEHRAVAVPSGVVEAVGKAARAFEGLDRVAIPVGVAVDTLRLGQAFHADGNKAGQQTIHTAGSVIGGWSGALAGAAGGAQAGATIGLLGGPVGSAVGGVAGGLVGGILGSFAGSALGEHAADDLAK